jgi:hypothetical protein
MAHHPNEPRLLDLLHDPVAETLMARDGVGRDAITSLLAWAAVRRTIEEPALPDEAAAR